MRKKISRKLKIFIGIIIIISIVVISIIIIKVNSSEKDITKDNNPEFVGGKAVTKDGDHEFISDEILIKFNDNISKDRAKEIIKEIGGTLIERPYWDYYEGGACEVELKHVFKKYLEIEEYCKNLKEKYKEIKYVETNDIIHAD